MPDGLQVVLTVKADAEVTKAAEIRSWRLTGVFGEDDEITVQAGRGAVYVRTGPGSTGVVSMFRPEIARELARALIAAADKSEPKEEETP